MHERKTQLFLYQCEGQKVNPKTAIFTDHADGSFLLTSPAWQLSHDKLSYDHRNYFVH